MRLLVGSVLFACVLVVSITGCRTGPITNVKDVAILSTTDKKLTIDDVRKGIIAGGKNRGWVMEMESPGNIVGTLNIRSHMAKVDIPYTSNTYSILYKDSYNLDYDAEDKTIHSNYNAWIGYLQESIQTEFFRMAYKR